MKWVFVVVCILAGLLTFAVRRSDMLQQTEGLQAWMGHPKWIDAPLRGLHAATTSTVSRAKAQMAAAAPAAGGWRELWARVHARLAPPAAPAAQDDSTGAPTAVAPPPAIADGEALVLNGISSNGAQSIAIINHRPAGVGDRVQGYVVRSVSPTGVELVGRGERVTLRTNGTRTVQPAL